MFLFYFSLSLYHSWCLDYHIEQLRYFSSNRPCLYMCLSCFISNKLLAIWSQIFVYHLNFEVIRSLFQSFNLNTKINFKNRIYTICSKYFNSITQKVGIYVYLKWLKCVRRLFISHSFLSSSIAFPIWIQGAAIKFF